MTDDWPPAPALRVQAHGFPSERNDLDAATMGAWVLTTAALFCAQADTWPAYREFHLGLLQLIGAKPSLVAMCAKLSPPVVADIAKALINGGSEGGYG